MQIPSINLSEIQLSYARSGGKGGQNVNKVNTKAVLHWNPDTSQCFLPFERQLIKLHLKNFINNEGFVVLSNETTRSQEENREGVIRRLHELVAKALIPKKKRVATRPTRGSKERRITTKKRHAGTKKLRRYKPSSE